MDPSKFLNFDTIQMIAAIEEGKQTVKMIVNIINGRIPPPGREPLASFYGRVVQHMSMRGVLVPLSTIGPLTQANPSATTTSQHE